MTPPRGWRRPDARIHEDVCEAMTRHGWLDARGIEVAVAGGEVTLTGAVEDRRARRLAEDIAAAVPGVRDVHNRLRLGQVERPQPDQSSREAYQRISR